MMKPYMQLFSSPNCKYYFDVNNKEMVPIPVELYEYLYNSIDIANNPLVAEYNEKGYLLSPNIKSIEHPYLRNILHLLDRKLSRITAQTEANESADTPKAGLGRL